MINDTFIDIELFYFDFILLKTQGTEQGLIVASNVGRVELSLAYFIKSGTLKVTILRCIDLPEMDNQGSANPFVQV